MKIKINKTIEACLLIVAALIAAIVTYTETHRLTGHFMQRATTELVSYSTPDPKPIVRTRTMYVAKKPTTPQKREVVTLNVPVKKPETQRVFKAASEPEVRSDFPAFEKAIYPVSKTPNWGVMTSEQEWERIYAEMDSNDFVSIPAYNLKNLTIPMRQLTRNRTVANEALITEKLFYSTRFFGDYDLDSNEYEGRHVGIDFKLAAGTPIGSIAGGIVHATGTNNDLGNYVMVLHRLPNTHEEVVSIYGHLDSVSVIEGRAVSPGTIIGYAGSTGKSQSPHLHLQIDYKKNPGRHSLYVPGSDVSISETSKWTLHPIEFIAKW